MSTIGPPPPCYKVGEQKTKTAQAIPPVNHLLSDVAKLVHEGLGPKQGG